MKSINHPYQARKVSEQLKVKNYKKTSIFSKIPKPLRKPLNRQNSKNNETWDSWRISQDHEIHKPSILSQKIVKTTESDKPKLPKPFRKLLYNQNFKNNAPWSSHWITKDYEIYKPFIRSQNNRKWKTTLKLQFYPKSLNPLGNP